jgi:hypothetical protein
VSGPGRQCGNQQTKFDYVFAATVRAARLLVVTDLAGGDAAIDFSLD